jgi:hypothetical protein
VISVRHSVPGGDNVQRVDDVDGRQLRAGKRLCGPRRRKSGKRCGYLLGDANEDADEGLVREETLLDPR